MATKHASSTDKLREVIQQQKQSSFRDPSKATDIEALGILIANWAEWDGQQILDTFLAALEDANFHTFRAKVAELWEQTEVV